MADRYWVGGSGNWDATSTANWSATSGGSAGASAPTSADNVIFDANSNIGTGTFTVTVTGTSAAPAVCNDFSTGGAGGALDGAMTLTMGATAFLDVYGSMTLPATNFSVSGTAGAGIRYKSTSTGKIITTNGVSLGNVAINFDGVGGGWTLGSAYTSTQSITITNGTFDTNSASSYNVTCTSLIFANASNVRQINLNASTLTLTTNNTNSINIPNVTNLTFNAGTSTIVCSGANNGIGVVSTGSITFYNVNLSATNASNSLLSGANTYNNLTIASPSSTGIRSVQLNSNQTVNGTLTLGTANTAIRRMALFSDVVGTSRTITLNGSLATLADVGFRDITAAGTAGTWTGTRLGNGGNVSGITTDTPKTVYRVGTGNWSATQWSLSSGGAVDVNNFPLAQDTVIFDTGTTTGTHTIDAGWWIGTLNMSALNVAVTLATGTTTPIFYGNVTLDADVTLSGTGALTFSGASNQTITSAGKTFTQPLTVNNPTTTSLLLGDAIITSNTFTLTQGTIDLNNFDLTCLTFSSSNSNTRSIAFGTGDINITGNNTTIFSTSTATNFTYTGTPTINLTYSGATGQRTVLFGSTGASETNTLNFNVTAGTDIVSLAGILGTLNFTGFSGSLINGVNRTICRDLVLSAGMTVSSGTGTTTFGGSGVQNISSAGATFVHTLISQTNTSGTVRLQSNFTFNTTYSHTAGTLDLNDFDLTTGLYSSTGSTTRQLDFGTGDLNITGASFTASGSNFSTAGTGAVSMNSASSKTFAGGGFSYKVLNQGGAGELIITGANTFTDITNTNATASTITFPNTTTTVSNFSAEGTVGNLLTLRRTGASGTFELAYVGTSRVDSDYLSISNSTASPSNTWYAGNTSTDGGGNTGWTFTAAPPLVDSTTQRLAEAGSVIVAQSKQTSTASRLGGAGQIEADIVRYKSEFSTKVSGLTVKGRLINKARE